jgi:YfiH family protein
MENLDRDRATHRGLRGPIHRTHAPRADLVEDPKLAAENFSMQKWVGGSHESVLIAELARCDENRQCPARSCPESAKPMDTSQYLRSELLSSAGFTHAFFTRRGGVSSGAFASLNLSLDVGDRPDDVAENRRRIADVLGVAEGRVYVPRQVHERGLLVVDGRAGAAEISTLPADAIISDGPGLACGVRTADCVPLLMACVETRRVAAVHAGWRGVVKEVARAAVEALVARGSRPERLLVAIGPHISPAAFEVGEEVARELRAASDVDGAVTVIAGQKPHAALGHILTAQLMALGVPSRHIEALSGCTFTDQHEFFSYRRDGKRSGRQLSAIVSPRSADDPVGTRDPG